MTRAADGASPRRRYRCAIYTRKSSEEGLEQDFNSLAAQREACEAFVKSQAHEGWKAVSTRYDDGGFSGGTLDRPALQQLLEAIKAHRVDVVVIYKIDRLSRSLMDFARLAEIFDAHRVSFVSVTQPFNTTTSMGRLMLNVLLSFAQFEREITGERIRDKVAASKKKGLWMGGNVPFGYNAKDRMLSIHETEAKTVRALYRLYLEHGCVRGVQAEASRLGLVSRRRTLATGRAVGGGPFGRGHLYRLLSNPVYVGRIAHRGETYAGLHPAIIDPTTWEAVQGGLARNGHSHRTRTNRRSLSLLAGLLVDEHGAKFRATQTAKGGRPYRYYTHPALVEGDDSSNLPYRHVPARDIEQAVLERLGTLFRSPAEISAALGDNPTASEWARSHRRCTELADQLRGAAASLVPTLQKLLHRVVLTTNDVQLQIARPGLREMLGLSADPGAHDCEWHEVGIPVRIRARTGQARVVIETKGSEAGARLDAGLIRTLGRAHRWWEQIEGGQANSVMDIAKQERLSGSLVTRILRTAFLAPDIIGAITLGAQPPGLSARTLINRPALPLDWNEQRRVLGFSPREADPDPIAEPAALDS